MPTGGIQTGGDRPAARMTFEGLQVLRGIAAAMVVFHHACWVINTYHPARSVLAGQRGLAELGAGGVDIFFCISGVVIAYAARAIPPGLPAAGTFALRRILRVLPPYWVFTAALLLLWLVGVGFKELRVTPGLVASSLLLIPYPKQTLDGHVSYHPILDVGWTLTFEMYFYAICTVIIAFAGGRRIWPWVLAALGVVAAVTTTTAGAASVAGGVLASPLLLEFVAGVALARFVAGRVAPRAGWAMILAAIAVFAASATVSDAMQARVLWWGIPGVLLVAGSLLIPVDARSRTNRVLLFFGTASYTIYLAHPFAMLVAGNVLKRGLLTDVPPDALLMLLTVLAIVGSALSYFVVEGPLIRLLKPRSRTAAEARAVIGA